MEPFVWDREWGCKERISHLDTTAAAFLYLHSSGTWPRNFFVPRLEEEHAVVYPWEWPLDRGSILSLFRIVGNVVILIVFKYSTDNASPFCLHPGWTILVAFSLVCRWEFGSLQPPFLILFCLSGKDLKIALLFLTSVVFVMLSPLPEIPAFHTHTSSGFSLLFKIQFSVTSSRKLPLLTRLWVLGPFLGFLTTEPLHCPHCTLICSWLYLPQLLCTKPR